MNGGRRTKKLQHRKALSSWLIEDISTYMMVCHVSQSHFANVIAENSKITNILDAAVFFLMF
jgi:hypothetical protein